MDYQKPEIIELPQAAESIQGMKLGGNFDSTNGDQPPYSVTIFAFDE